jgi:transposase
LIALAVDLVEKRLRKGTASSQETTHFLKLGSTTARLEKEILEEQKKLIKAKTEALESQKDVEEMFKKAIIAMKTYQGARNDGDD